MHVDVENALAGPGEGIGHQPETSLVQALRSRQLDGPQLQPAEKFPVAFFGLQKARDMPAGDDQDVCRGLRVDVTKRDHVIVLVDDVGRDLASGYFAEEAVLHDLTRLRTTCQKRGLQTRSTCAPRAPSLRSIFS